MSRNGSPEISELVSCCLATPGILKVINYSRMFSKLGFKMMRERESVRGSVLCKKRKQETKN
jgi:hypothetical protein